MSAPKLPLVDVVVWRDPNGRPRAAQTPCRLETDLPAVALPWALLEDEEFQLAVAERHLSEMDPDSERYPTWFEALAAELRARAGGGA